MPYKVTIASPNGKSWKVEVPSENLFGKAIGDKVNGADITEGLQGYEFTLTGATDNAGFAHKADVEGQGLRRVLLTKGWGMKKKKKGLRLRKTVRGKELGEKTVQVNLIITKEGAKALLEVFPDQNKTPEPEAKEAPQEAAPAQ